MSRKLCLSCQRPALACICQFSTPVSNDTHVVVLQHPSEVKQVKGTIALLATSLNSCQVIVGEDFSNNEILSGIVKQYKPLLLYPGEKSKTLSKQLITELKNKDSNDNEHNKQRVTKPLCLIILDGTWKKAYRILMLSTNLQKIPQICLPDYLANAGQYHIRKVAKKNALSSLEATCYALAMLDAVDHSVPVSPEKMGKYQDLLNKFNAFNLFQLSFRPAAHRCTSRIPNDS